MERNITQAVYDSLTEATKTIAPLTEELESVNSEIRSNRYTSEALQNELYPKRDELKRKVNGKANAAIDAAKALVAQYRKEVEKMNDLDPHELTEDIKLLQAGISLKDRDIRAIIERNSGNRTMTQLALRYAADHGIDMGGTYYIGGQEERETANILDNTIEYYRKWITQGNALTVLDKFFGVG